MMHYKNFENFQKFYVNVFGWDMFELPEAAGGTGRLDGGGECVRPLWKCPCPGQMSKLKNRKQVTIRTDRIEIEKG